MPTAMESKTSRGRAFERFGAWLLVGVRSALAVAIFGSAALVIDYQNPGDPAFCGVESACFRLRTSESGKDVAKTLDALVPGLQLPTLGLLLFVTALAASFFLKGRLHARLFGAAMAVAGLSAAYFIHLQQKISIYCAYCMLVDGATLVGATLAVVLALGIDDARLDTGESRTLAPANLPSSVIAWGVGVAIITVAPFVWARFPQNPPLPAPIAALQEPGKTVIVSFTDFQCPFCRRIHPVIHELEQKPDVVVHRYMVPLDFHPGAMPSALAYKCTPEAQQGAMVDALYAAEPTRLTYEGVVEIAGEVGVEDLPGLRRCMSLKETKDAIDQEKLLFYDELGGQGVPMTWVGKTLVKGAREAGLISAYDRAAGPNFGLPLWSLFAFAGSVLAGVLVATGRVLRSGRRALAADEPEEHAEATGADRDEVAPVAKPAKRKRKKAPAAPAASDDDEGSDPAR